MARWVSFPEVAEQTEGVLTVGYTGMPQGMDPASLELNVGALQRGVIGWGGYSTLTLAAYAGDRDQISYTASDADESGAGYAAGAAVVSKAETADHNSASEKARNALDIRNGTLGVQWNINALNDKIELHEQFSPATRAKQLDRAIRTEAIKGILTHNTVDVLKDRIVPTTAIYGVLDAWFLSELTREYIENGVVGAAGELVFRALLFKGLLAPIRTLFNFSERAGFRDQIIDTTFFTARPGRALIGASVLAASKIVRPWSHPDAV